MDKGLDRRTQVHTNFGGHPRLSSFFPRFCLDAIEKQPMRYIARLFSVPPTTNFFWKISENRITKRLEYKPESFKFTFILNVTV